jgi:cation diffusion facilitator family transporter
MITLLSKIFIKNNKDFGEPRVRNAYGLLCSVMGIVLNLLLFAGKYIAGTISASIAITADAFNNLSDAGSSLITLFGFKFAGKKPDAGHPFGHGRIEYIAGFIVSLVILLMGFELLKGSIEKISAPEDVDTGLLPILILCVSIIIKLYMGFYNRAVGKKINSAAMKAVAMDSLSDTFSTLAVLISMLIIKFAGVNIDAYCGILVSLFVLYAGFTSAKDTLGPLLGQAPDPEFVSKVQEVVLAHKEISGIHDMVVHDYGPGRVMVTLHAEVPADGDILEMHDAIDLAERDLSELGCEAVIHMDPISTSDEKVVAMREKMTAEVKQIGEELSIHDFRVVHGPTHTNLIFDVVVPADYRLSDTEVVEEINKRVADHWEDCYAVVTVDRAYV